MKKGIILVAALAAASASGMIYTKSAYKDSIDASLSMYADNFASIGIQVKRDIVSQSAFVFEDTFSFTLTPEFFQSIDSSAPAEAMTFAVKNNCQVYPAYISCENEFDFSAMDLPVDMVSAFKDFKYKSGWSLNPITDSVTSYFNSELLEIDEDGVKISLQPMTILSDSTLDFSEMSVNWQWQGIQLSAPDFELEVQGIEILGDMTHLAGLTFLGTSDFIVKDIKATDNLTFTTQMTDVLVRSDMSEYEKDKFDTRYTISAKELTASGGAMPLDLKDVVIDSRMFGFTKKAFTLLNEIQFKTEPTEQDFVELVDAFGESELGLDIEKFAFTLNGTSVNADADIDFATFTFADIQTQQMMDKFSGIANAKVDKAVAESFPQFVPMLEQYVEMGLAKVDAEGNYLTQVQYKDLVLSANDTPLQSF